MATADGHASVLGVSCRAPGGEIGGGHGASTAARGEIFLENHPEHGGAYTVVDPRHWLLELAGKHVESWAVRVRIGAIEFDSVLRRPLTDYSSPRPGLDVALPGRAVLEAVTAGGTIEVEVRGEEAALEAVYEPSANARRAAALMLAECAPDSGPLQESL